MSTATYTQQSKNKSRDLILKEAVISLTKNRKKSRILNESYLRKLWFYCKNIITLHTNHQNMEDHYFDDWISFANISYGKRRPQELKVAILCGPEPKNDVEILLGLGIRIENIYAFESESAIYSEALISIKNTYPTLKIFKGKLESIIPLLALKFDIIYLDYTKSLLSKETVISLFSIFDSQLLADLGVIIVNTCLPDKTDENVKTLSEFFYHQYSYEDFYFHTKNDKEKYSQFMEGFSANGYYFSEDIEPIVRKNFSNAYSAFATQFPIYYASFIVPILKVLQNQSLAKKLFSDKIESKSFFIDLESKYYVDLINDDMESSNFGFYKFLKNNSQIWGDFFEKKERGVGRIDAVLCKYFLCNIEQISKDLLSDLFISELPLMYNNVVGKIDRFKPFLFCDAPLPHLWTELAINQFGYPYHFNTENHTRYQYVAKTREMYLDVFTFDKCRPLYDWLPLLDYYKDDLNVIERQIVTRMCLDIIEKNCFNITSNLYHASALIGYNEENWSKLKELIKRKNIQ